MSAVIHRQRAAMGTWFEAWLVGDDTEHLAAVAGAAFDEVERVERLLSRFDSRSEVCRVNREAAARAVRVDHELIAILQACRAGWARTGGGFDPTTRAGRPGNLGAVAIDDQRATVRFLDDRLALDFGGFGKGYALDRAAEVLAAFGVRSALLHGGTSSVLALGCDADGRAWEIAVRDVVGVDGRSRAAADASARVAPSPAATRDHRSRGERSPAEQTGEGAPGTIRLSDRALSCSFVFAGNRSVSDLVDPRTGRALSRGEGCVVIDASGAEAEMASTGLLAMGRAWAARYAEHEHEQEGRAVAWLDAGAAVDWLTGGKGLR